MPAAAVTTPLFGPIAVNPPPAASPGSGGAFSHALQSVQGATPVAEAGAATTAILTAPAGAVAPGRNAWLAVARSPSGSVPQPALAAGADQATTIAATQDLAAPNSQPAPGTPPAARTPDAAATAALAAPEDGQMSGATPPDAVSASPIALDAAASSIAPTTLAGRGVPPLKVVHARTATNRDGPADPVGSTPATLALAVAAPVQQAPPPDPTRTTGRHAAEAGSPIAPEAPRAARPDPHVRNDPAGSGQPAPPSRSGGSMTDTDASGRLAGSPDAANTDRVGLDTTAEGGFPVTREALHAARPDSHVSSDPPQAFAPEGAGLSRPLPASSDMPAQRPAVSATPAVSAAPATSGAPAASVPPLASAALDGPAGASANALFRALPAAESGTRAAAADHKLTLRPTEAVADAPRPAAAVSAIAEPTFVSLLPTGLPAEARVAASPPAHGASPVAVAEQVAPALLTLGKSGDGSQEMTVRLQPVELGAVQIRISRAASGLTRIDITAERPGTLLALQRDQPQLHRTLDQAGIPAVGRTVSFHAAAPAPTPAAGSGQSGPPSRSGGSSTDADASAHGGRGSYLPREQNSYSGGRRLTGSPVAAAANAAVAAKTYRIGLDITA